ncbi:hypothetical protein AB0D97_18760 [Streptomyces roseus]|uniref:hypothetical protein n=1 Tax=Streptomyces roseus TaxID=66430 RepID=UPI0033D85120
MPAIEWNGTQPGPGQFGQGAVLLESAQVSAENRSVDRAGDRVMAMVTAALDRGTVARKRS